mgnify:CR=1 FL=1
MDRLVRVAGPLVVNEPGRRGEYRWSPLAVVDVGGLPTSRAQVSHGNYIGLGVYIGFGLARLTRAVLIVESNPLLS